MRKRFVNIYLGIVVLVAVGLGTVYIYNKSDDNNQNYNKEIAVSIPSSLKNSSLNVDFSKSSISLDQILSGGPGKDGIPALSKPKFVQQKDSDVADDTQVIYVENNGEEKIYPYNILVWHEIVNDEVGGKQLVITFCPLCGSAIVFDANIDGKNLEFGVSGFLYESNLIMYSREQSETLWSQSLSEAVVGERTGTKLELYPMQLLSFADAKSKYPNAIVMSTNTGYQRDYTGNPYSGYSDSEQTYFPVSVTDKRFPAKEVFFIIPDDGNQSVAVRQNKSDGIYKVPNTRIEVIFDKGGIEAKNKGVTVPGYYEMWFSWATQHQDNGVVLD